MSREAFRHRIYEQLGENVRQARKSAGLTQEQLAKAVSLSRTSITNIEKGRQKILLDTLYDIAYAVGKPAIDLLPNVALVDDDDVLQHIQPDLSEADQAWIKALIHPEEELKNGSPRKAHP